MQTEDKRKNVLVIGGAGYIGGAVTEELQKRGIPFTVYDNLTYEQQYLKPVDFIYGDIRDRHLLKSILPKYTHVIWLAAIVGDDACAINPDLTYEVNRSSVQWLVRTYSGRILFTSTCSVYGAYKAPVTETTPPRPLSVYAKSKLGAEEALRDKALVIRLGTVYGISDSYSRIRMDLAINYMTAVAVTKNGITIFGGRQWRPFIHVKDIGAVLVRGLYNDITGVFNVATCNSTIYDIGKLIQKETGCNLQIADTKLEDNRNYRVDSSKALNAGLLSPDSVHDPLYGIREVGDLVASRRIKNAEHEAHSNYFRLVSSMEEYKNHHIYAVWQKKINQRHKL